MPGQPDIESPRTGGAAPPPGPAVVGHLDAIGIDGERAPQLWRHAGLAAIVSIVSRDEWCGAAAEANLQELAWVAPRSLRHEAVLEAATRSAPVFPARFGSLFSSSAALGRLMERHHETIGGFLERVGRQQEWAVKGILDRARAEAELGAPHQAAVTGKAALSPGLAYLFEQQSRRKAKEDLEEKLAAACNSLLERLHPLASEARSRPVLSGECAAAPEEMISNWAFLVPPRAVAEFQQRVQQGNSDASLPGLTFAISGPWPPYSFCPPLSPE